MSRIFISPQHGKYVGQLLVFDHVESINHVSNSTIPQHPVESGSKSIADHRYKQPFKLSIVGNISDQWLTKATILPLSVFQTSAHKMQKLLRTQTEQINGDSLVTKIVNDILDKTYPTPDDPQLQVDLDKLDDEDLTWTTRALQIVAKEEDTLDIANDKELSLSFELRNTQRLGTEINTIAQAEEMLTHLDNNNTLVSVYSLYRRYPNMVIQSFRNDTRQGAQRGAYWVSIDFEQQLVAQTVSTEIAIKPKDSEEVNDEERLGKNVPIQEVDKATLDIATKIVNDLLPDYNNLKNRTTKEKLDAVIVTVAEQYIKSGGSVNPNTAYTQATIQAKLSLGKLLVQTK